MHRILVLNDSPILLKGIRHLLIAEGYQITCVTDSYEALSVLREEPIDLFIQDILRPDINGFELYWLMKSEEKLRDIPVLILSNWSAVDVTELERSDRRRGRLYKIGFRDTRTEDLEKLTNIKDANVLYVEGYLHVSAAFPNLAETIREILSGIEGCCSE